MLRLGILALVGLIVAFGIGYGLSRAKARDRNSTAGPAEDIALERAELRATLQELRVMYEQDPWCQGSRFEDQPMVQEVLADLARLEGFKAS